jgi:hypothetical protein
MTDLNKLALLHVAILLGIAVVPARAQAQWWSSKEPVDYEDCVAKGEKAAGSADAKAALASQCDAKFAGRRKPGGGYTYFDFMQNRSFDIAGPNPTADELRGMDEQYTAFLDDRRRRLIAAAFAAKQQQLAALQAQRQAVETPPLPKPRLVVEKSRTPDKAHPRPEKPRNAERHRTLPRPHYACNNDPVSCGLTHLSAGFTAVKSSLFGESAKKPRVHRTAARPAM